MNSQLVKFDSYQYHAYNFNEPHLIPFLFSVSDDSVSFSVSQLYSLIHSDLILDLKANLPILANAWSVFLRSDYFDKSDYFVSFAANISLAFSFYETDCLRASDLISNLIMFPSDSFTPITGLPEINITLMRSVLKLVFATTKSHLSSLDYTSTTSSTSAFNIIRFAEGLSMHRCLSCYLKLLFILSLSFVSLETFKKELLVLSNNVKSTPCISQALFAYLLSLLELSDSSSTPLESGLLDTLVNNFLRSKHSSPSNFSNIVASVSSELDAFIQTFQDGLDAHPVAIPDSTTVTDNINTVISETFSSLGFDGFSGVSSTVLTDRADSCSSTLDFLNSFIDLAFSFNISLDQFNFKSDIDDLLLPGKLFECL